MKIKPIFPFRHETRATTLGFLFVSASLPVFAASATWNGSTDALWETAGNWSATPVPGTGDTATFNSAGGVDDVINLGAGVTINSLLFDTANVAAYTLGSGAVGSQTLNLNSGGNITLNNTIAQNQLINANVLLGGSYTITNNDTANTLTIAGGISGSGADLSKTGAGTLILSGLSTTAANNYTGTTILAGGITTLSQDASLTGGLTFGASASQNVASTLNLNSASATYAGTMFVQTNSALNTITIGSGQKLTVNGNVSFTAPGQGSQSRLSVSGLGGWDVIASNGVFGGISAQNGNRMEVDLSGLATFNANLRTGGSGSAGGVFRVGGIGGSTNDRTNFVNLATNSTISSDVVELTMNSQLGTANLVLGNGTQTINSDDIRMSTSSRENSNITFGTADGTLKIRGTDGGETTRSNLSMLSGVNTGSNRTSTFNVSGHEADLLFNNARILNHSASIGGSYTATFSFDRGTLDATTFQVGAKTGGNMSNVLSGVANIGSVANHTSLATLSALNMGVFSTGGAAAVGSALNSTLNITGNATTVNFDTMSMANYSGTTGTSVDSIVNISGGTTTGTGGIDMATAANGSVNSTLTVSGGTLSVGTGGVNPNNGIYRTTGSVNATTTLVLNGGSLNLNGNNIGDAGANAIVIQFDSGTLSNIGEINGGEDSDMSTSGMLTLSGTNTYTGATHVNAGTLITTTAAALPGYNIAGKVTFGGGTIAVRDPGAGGWTTMEVDTLLSNANKISGALGIEVTSGSLSQWTPFTPTNFGPALGLTKLGGGVLVLNQTNTFVGLTTVSAGTLTLGHPTDTLSGNITVNGGTLNVDNPDMVGAVTLISGTISGDSALTGSSYSVENGFISTLLAGSGVTLTKTSSGKVLLNNSSNSYSGGTVLNEGTLAIRSSGNTLGAGTFTINGGIFGSVVSARSLGNDILINNDFQLGGVNVPNPDNPATNLGNAATTFLGNVDLGGATRTVTIADGATINGVISNGGLTIIANPTNRTLTLGGNSTYNGPTHVNSGSLFINGNNSSATGTITVAANATLGGNGTSGGPLVMEPNAALSSRITDWTGAAGIGYEDLSVASLDAGGGALELRVNTTGLTNFTESSKSFTILNASGGIVGFDTANVTITTTGFAGTGTWALVQSGTTLVLNYMVADPYLNWINPFNVADETQGADPDNDGISNLMEFVLNGNPGVSETNILPDLTLSSSQLTFSYVRRVDSTAVPQVVQYGSNLTGWTPVTIPSATGTSTEGVATVVVSAPASGTQTVTVTIPTSAELDGKLFARLKVGP